MKEKKKFKLGLLPKLIIAIIVGILFGQFLPEGFCRFVVTLSSFFSQFLSFIIPLMILAYVTMGIANRSTRSPQPQATRWSRTSAWKFRR